MIMTIMNEWIELNLPWYVRDYQARVGKPYPDLNERAKKELGETKEEVAARTIEVLPRDPSKFMHMPEIDHFNDARAEIRKNLEDEGWGAEGFEKEINRRLVNLNDAIVNNVFEYRAFSDKYNAWYDGQPEVLEVIRHNIEIYKRVELEESTKSFCGMKLNKAGTLIEFEEDGIAFQQLIGDLNEIGGVCDDCMGVRADTLIKRYKIVWKA